MTPVRGVEVRRAMTWAHVAEAGGGGEEGGRRRLSGCGGDVARWTQGGALETAPHPGQVVGTGPTERMAGGHRADQAELP
jgi:hypothetical protein